MANTFITAEILAKELALILKHEVHFPKLVYTDYSDDFVAGQGEKVKVIKPTTFTANDFNGTISAQNINEQEIIVELDKIIDVSLNISARDLTLSIDEISERVLKPAARAIAEKIDRDIANRLALITTPVDTFKEGEFTLRDLIDARKVLTLNDVPKTDRYFVAGAEAEADLLASDQFMNADKKGDTVALKEANLGRVVGFDVYSSNAVDEGALAFHKNAIAFVNRPLVAPSTAESYVWQEDGISIRITKQYDINTKTEKFSVDCLYGIATLDANLAVHVIDQPE